jgi:hypothetical protein
LWSSPVLVFALLFFLFKYRYLALRALVAMLKARIRYFSSIFGLVVLFYFLLQNGSDALELLAALTKGSLELHYELVHVYADHPAYANQLGFSDADGFIFLVSSLNVISFVASLLLNGHYAMLVGYVMLPFGLLSLTFVEGILLAMPGPIIGIDIIKAIQAVRLPENISTLQQISEVAGVDAKKIVVQYEAAFYQNKPPLNFDKCRSWHMFLERKKFFFKFFDLFLPKGTVVPWSDIFVHYQKGFWLISIILIALARS